MGNSQEYLKQVKQRFALQRQYVAADRLAKKSKDPAKRAKHLAERDRIMALILAK